MKRWRLLNLFNKSLLMLLLDVRRVVQRFIERGIFSRRWRPSRFGGATAPPLLLPRSHQVSAERLVDPSVFSRPKFVARVLDTTNLDPVLQDFINAFLKELDKRKMPFFVSEAYRPRERQNALFKQGVSKARWGQSAHNFGLGVDIVHFTRFWGLTPKEWAIIGLIGKEVARKRGVSVVWGGDWSFYDPAHWELSDWRLRKDIPLSERRYRFDLGQVDRDALKRPLKALL